MTLALIVGLATVATSQSNSSKENLELPKEVQQQLYTVTVFNPDTLYEEAKACFKAKGQGATLYNLDENAGAELVGYACIQAVK